MECDYLKQRAENIKNNLALLESLGLDKPLFEPKAKRPAKKTAPKTKKRKSPEPDAEEAAEPQVAAKAAKLDETSSSRGSLRRSSRNNGKTIDYRKEIVKDEIVTITRANRLKSVDDDTGPMGREDGARKHNPKTYGHIPGVEIGTWWEQRKGCSTDAIHAPWVGGIHGGKDGAFSVALSGGYDDDVDLGYAFTYTGSGGRDLKGTKDAPKNLRTAPQSCDQTWDSPFNHTLRRSAETRKPVRVVRGFKLKSKYAPIEGYRYDGLYVVEKAWMEKGVNKKGYLVCKFAFKRLPGQPPLPVRDTGDEDAEDGEPQEEEPEADEAADDDSEQTN